MESSRHLSGFEGEGSTVDVEGFAPGRRYFVMTYYGWSADDPRECSRCVLEMLRRGLPGGTRYFGVIGATLCDEVLMRESPYVYDWVEAAQRLESRWVSVLIDFGDVEERTSLRLAGDAFILCGRGPTVFCFRQKGDVGGDDGRIEEEGTVFERVFVEQEALRMNAVVLFGKPLIRKNS